MITSTFIVFILDLRVKLQPLWPIKYLSINSFCYIRKKNFRKGNRFIHEYIYLNDDHMLLTKQTEFSKTINLISSIVLMFSTIVYIVFTAFLSSAKFR